MSPPPTPDETVSPVIAVFDVDGTLYDLNTLYDFLERYHAGGSRIRQALFRTSRTLAGKVFWFGATRLTPGELFRHLAFRSLRGERVADVTAACAAYVDEVLPAHARTAVSDRLQAYRASGAHVVLASGSLQQLIDAVAWQVGADAALAVELEVDRGRFTGRVVRDVRGQKWRVLQEAYPELDRFDVVTDNQDDLEIVRAATRATVVTRARHRTWWDGQRLAHVEFVDV